MNVFCASAFIGEKVGEKEDPNQNRSIFLTIFSRNKIMKWLQNVRSE